MTRRQVLTVASGSLVSALGLPVRAQVPDNLHPNFPAQDPERVRQVVGASHSSLETVKELVNASPALAKAVWDWGYGDWESALGAASHTGRREIADFLVANGARPDVFYYAMIGHLEAVKAMIAADPRIVSFQGPHGLTLMSHARAGGDDAKAVVAYLESVSGADKMPTNLELTDAGKEIYLGRYTFAGGPDDYMEVVKHRLGFLQLRRGENGNGVRLNRIGEHEFAPGGAPAVRIVFTVDGAKANGLSIHDPTPILTAKRT